MGSQDCNEVSHRHMPSPAPVEEQSRHPCALRAEWLEPALLRRTLGPFPVYTKLTKSQQCTAKQASSILGHVRKSIARQAEVGDLYSALVREVSRRGFKHFHPTDAAS